MQVSCQDNVSNTTRTQKRQSQFKGQNCSLTTSISNLPNSTQCLVFAQTHGLTPLCINNKQHLEFLLSMEWDISKASYVRMSDTYIPVHELLRVSLLIFEPSARSCGAESCSLQTMFPKACLSFKNNIFNLCKELCNRATPVQWTGACISSGWKDACK